MPERRTPKPGAPGVKARGFTWDRSVEEVYRLYREVLSGAPAEAGRKVLV